LLLDPDPGEKNQCGSGSDKGNKECTKACQAKCHYKIKKLVMVANPAPGVKKFTSISEEKGHFERLCSENF
jgi:hypothetical protein